jgi:serine/threonine protein kinase
MVGVFLLSERELCFGCMNYKRNVKICSHCSYKIDAGPESVLHLKPGTVLESKYVVGRALGQGGFGITYIAWDQKLNLKLAIKEYLPQDLAFRTIDSLDVTVYKESLRQQFKDGLNKYLNEARILARFAGHPNIVWIRDYFEAYGTAYIVMEYIEGLTLKGYLINYKKPLSFTETMQIFMPVLDALKEVHAAGMLHRDISPDNIMLAKTGRVVLIDFGAARQSVCEQSRSLSVIMKAGFSPEEQYHSRGKQGAWTDIYSVAATIYTALTGIIPPESLSRLSEDSLTPPSQFGVEIDSRQEKILLKALAVKATNRYQTVQDLQDNLLQIINRGQNDYNQVEKGFDLSISTLSEVKDVKQNQPINANMNLKLWSQRFDVACPLEIKIGHFESGKKKSLIYLDISYYLGIDNRRLENLEGKNIIALKIIFSFFDVFHEPLLDGFNSIERTIKNLYIRPGNIIREAEAVEIVDISKNIDVHVDSILYADNSVWNYNGNNKHEVSVSILEGKDLEDLRSVAGIGSFCYANSNNNYWQCVCRRGNALESDHCLRCGRKKEFVLEKCRNRASIQQALIEQKEELAKKEYLIQVEKEQWLADYPKRPFWKRILGFRTLTPWKMLVGGSFYLLILYSYFPRDAEYRFTSILPLIADLSLPYLAASITERRPVIRHLWLIAAYPMIFLIKTFYYQDAFADTLIYLFIILIFFSISGFIFSLINRNPEKEIYGFLSLALIAIMSFVVWAGLGNF